MALAGGFTEHDVSADGRVVVWQDKAPYEVSRQELILTFYVRKGLDLGDGKLAVEVSVQGADADVDEASHWHVVEGLDDLQDGVMYTIAVRSPWIALTTSGVTGENPSGIVYVG